MSEILETVNITPDWVALMPVLWEVAANGTSHKGRQEAQQHLIAMGLSHDLLRKKELNDDGSMTLTTDDLAKISGYFKLEEKG